MTMPTFPTADIEDLDRQLAEMKSALIASRDRIAATHGTTHSMQMAHADMLSRYDTMRQRVEYMRVVAPMMNVGATAPPPVTKRAQPVGLGRPLRKLGDAFGSTATIRKSALNCATCGIHHVSCAGCGRHDFDCSTHACR